MYKTPSVCRCASRRSNGSWPFSKSIVKTISPPPFEDAWAMRDSLRALPDCEVIRVMRRSMVVGSVPTAEEAPEGPDWDAAAVDPCALIPNNEGKIRIKNTLSTGK